MKKDRDCRIIRLGDRILRILDAEEEKALVIDCVKMGIMDAKVDKSVRDRGRCGNPRGRVHGGDGAGYPGRDVCICQTDHA